MEVIMLTSTRLINKKLITDADIVIIISGVKSNQVRIGIDASKEISVYRDEVFALIQANKES